MTMRKIAQRIPFTPSKTQAALFDQRFGDRRFAYNQQVEAFNTTISTTGVSRHDNIHAD